MRKGNKGDEFDQNTLYAYIEISQWNSFVQLIYASKKEKNRQTTSSKILV
jgi:hypothetical protein